MLGSLVTWTLNSASKKTRFISQRGPIPNLWAQLNLIQIPTGAKATTAFKSMCVWGGQGQGTSSDICPGNICSGDIFLWWHFLDQNFSEPNFVLDKILLLQKFCGTNFFLRKNNVQYFFSDANLVWSIYSYLNKTFFIKTYFTNFSTFF